MNPSHSLQASSVISFFTPRRRWTGDPFLVLTFCGDFLGAWDLVLRGDRSFLGGFSSSFLLVDSLFLRFFFWSTSLILSRSVGFGSAVVLRLWTNGEQRKAVSAVSYVTVRPIRLHSDSSFRCCVCVTDNSRFWLGSQRVWQGARTKSCWTKPFRVFRWYILDYMIHHGYFIF
jgi:hypothetical protein